jgi:tRNA (guanine37-N1)-methyltransferase
MKIDILTLFPEMFVGPFSESILKRAQDKSLVQLNVHNLRDWAENKHKMVDDKPYGGGAGMVLMVEPIYNALKDLKTNKHKNQKTILLSPQGQVFNQQKAKELSDFEHLILIAGHYEGFDERIRENLIDEEISIGNYVLTGGELPAMVIADTIIRLIPGVLGDSESLSDETHSQLTETAKSISTNIKYPVYTRPENFKGWKVPDILLSGHHKEIKEWRENKSTKNLMKQE